MLKYIKIGTLIKWIIRPGVWAYDKVWGIGDIAYVVFRPFVYSIDLIWGTDLKDCDMCKARRKKMNQFFSMRAYIWLSFVALVYMLTV